MGPDQKKETENSTMHLNKHDLNEFDPEVLWISRDYMIWQPIFLSFSISKHSCYANLLFSAKMLMAE